MSQSLKKVNSRLYTTLDSIKTGIIYCNEEGTVKVINEGAVKLLGIKKDLKDVPGTNVCPYFDSKLSMDKIAANTKNGETYCYELVSSGCPDFVYKRNYLLYCYIRRINIGEKEQEYIITLSKQTEAHLNATKMIYAEPTFSFDDIIGSSDAIRQVKTIAELGAAHNPSILITGESGTGKELFAQSIHNASSRRNGPFVAINCGAIPRTLIESELFGYTAGSFTGAAKGGKAGKFELADGGTIFLDEIGEMPLFMQAKLLRALQSGEIQKIGSDTMQKVDVRVIAATNRNLKQMVRDGKFREDLYFRLNTFTIVIPPLRERGEDVLLLAEHFLGKFSKKYGKTGRLSSAVQRFFLSYAWPGNVRQLESCMEYAVIVCGDGEIRMEHLPEELQGLSDNGERTDAAEASAAGAPHGLKADIQAMERDYILRVLKETGGNKTKAMEVLGISRRTFYKKWKLYGLDKEPSIK